MRKRSRKGKSRRRSNPHRAKARRSHGRRRRHSNPRRGHRRNPSRGGRTTWTSALLDSLIGLGGGGVAYGADWGISMIPIAPVWQSVIFGTAGLAGSVALAKWVSPAAGAGLAGGTGYGLIGRVREQLALRKLAAEDTSTPAAASSAAAGTVVNMARRPGIREAGAVTSMSRGPNYGPQFTRNREAGNVSYSLPQGTRLMGPASWIYRDGGAVVSAHNTR